MTDAPATRTVITKRPADRLAPKPKKNAPIIDIGVDEGDEYLVRIVGVDYTAHRAKALLAIRLQENLNDVLNGDDIEAKVEALGEFMGLILDSEEAAALMARLGDADDRLDVHHLLRFIEAVTARSGGVPPTSPSA